MRDGGVKKQREIAQRMGGENSAHIHGDTDVDGQIGKLRVILRSQDRMRQHRRQILRHGRVVYPGQLQQGVRGHFPVDRADAFFQGQARTPDMIGLLHPAAPIFGLVGGVSLRGSVTGPIVLGKAVFHFGAAWGLIHRQHAPFRVYLAALQLKVAVYDRLHKLHAPGAVAQAMERLQADPVTIIKNGKIISVVGVYVDILVDHRGFGFDHGGFLIGLVIIPKQPSF